MESQKNEFANTNKILAPAKHYRSIMYGIFAISSIYLYDYSYDNFKGEFYDVLAVIAFLFMAFTGPYSIFIFWEDLLRKRGFERTYFFYNLISLVFWSTIAWWVGYFIWHVIGIQFLGLSPKVIPKGSFRDGPALIGAFAILIFLGAWLPTVWHRHHHEYRQKLLKMLGNFKIDYYYRALGGFSNCTFVGIDIENKRMVIKDRYSEPRVIDLNDIWKIWSFDYQPNNQNIFISGGGSPGLAVAAGVTTLAAATTNAISEVSKASNYTGLYINLKNETDTIMVRMGAESAAKIVEIVKKIMSGVVSPVDGDPKEI